MRVLSRPSSHTNPPDPQATSSNRLPLEPPSNPLLSPSSLSVENGVLRRSLEDVRARAEAAERDAESAWIAVQKASVHVSRAASSSLSSVLRRAAEGAERLGHKAWDAVEGTEVLGGVVRVAEEAAGRARDVAAKG